MREYLKRIPIVVCTQPDIFNFDCGCSIKGYSRLYLSSSLLFGIHLKTFGPVTHCAKNKIWVLASFFVMASLQIEEDCQNNDPNNLFPTEMESSLRFPLDSSMRIIFTGYYNGIGVEIRGLEEMSMLYHMGCFGKGTRSRSKPKALNHDGNPAVMRKRQYLKRNYWYKKFKPEEHRVESDTFVTNVERLTAKILHDSVTRSNKDVIDLVSSDEDESDTIQSNLSEAMEFYNDKQDTVVIVPDSDSEAEDYFANLKPKCCINKTQLNEILMLTKQEAFFLLYGLGSLQIFNSENKILRVQDCWRLFCEADKNFVVKYVVYHYYRSKGYVVKPGIKFGGDYLLYREGPGINHSDYIVVIKDNNTEYNTWLSILGHIRMAITTVKEVLLIEVIEPNKNNLKLPQDLSEYSVKEIVLTRNIPVTINKDLD